MRLRRVLVVVGVLAAGLGFAMVLVPDIAAFSTRSMLGIVAVVALLQGGRVVRDRVRSAPTLAETPDPETEQDLAAPGEDFDETLAKLRERPPEAARARNPSARRRRGNQHRRRQALVERVETAAVNALVRHHGWSRERAREAIRTGEWTDDPYAAAFFTDELDGVGLRGRISQALSSERPFQRRAKHAADAVAAIESRVDDDGEGSR